MGSRAGFTRADLVMVLVVSAVLTVVGFGALQRVGQAGEETEQLLKARQWPVFWQKYATDHGGLMAQAVRPFEKWGDPWSHSWKGANLDYANLGNDARAASHKPADDPMRDCRETVFATVSPYVDKPDAFALNMTNEPLNSKWGKGPMRSLLGWYGGVCSAELGSAPCWWKGDAGGSVPHCNGWDVGYAPGSYWWYPGPDKMGYTLEQWKTNTVPNTGANELEKGWSFSGPTRRRVDVISGGLALNYYDSGTAGPDGLLMSSAGQAIENGTDAHLLKETGVLKCTAANVSGEARTFMFHNTERFPLVEGGKSLQWGLTHYQGWLEMVQWVEGTHPCLR